MSWIEKLCVLVVSSVVGAFVFMIVYSSLPVMAGTSASDKIFVNQTWDSFNEPSIQKFTYDHCEYLAIYSNNKFSFTHKGNCRNHASR
jgi:hypothetical protein